MTGINMSSSTRRVKLTIIDLVVCAMLGAVMFCGDVLMEALPNIHLVGVLLVAYTIVFRVKALIPLYVYIGLTFLFNGFSVWTWPYAYIWTILWGTTMLIPQNIPRWVKYIVYPLNCCLHGLAFGTLYAPVQALVFHFNFEQTIAWILHGLLFDAIHASGNLVGGIAIVPVADFLAKLRKRARI